MRGDSSPDRIKSSTLTAALAAAVCAFSRLRHRRQRGIGGQISVPLAHSAGFKGLTAPVVCASPLKKGCGFLFYFNGLALIVGLAGLRGLKIGAIFGALKRVRVFSFFVCVGGNINPFSPATPTKSKKGHKNKGFLVVGFFYFVLFSIPPPRFLVPLIP